MSTSLDRGRTRLLYSETRWLMRLRWAAGVVMVVVGAIHWKFLHVYQITYEPVVMGAAILAVNAAFVALLKWRPGIAASLESLITFASVQLHLDLLCLIVLAMWTGGATSPVLSAFFFHMIFAALLQPRNRAYVVSLTAVVGLALALWLSGQWPQTREEAIRISAWVLTLIVTVYLTDSVARSLYQREAAHTRQLARIRALSETTRAQQNSLIQSEKMAAMGQLAAGVAHEITNPLASMDSVLQLMQRRPDAPRPEAVATLREQVQRILRIVRQLTTYAHPGMGRIESLPVNDLVRASLEMLALSRKMQRVAIDTDLADDAGSARMNPHALQQVLTNLLVNALDATADSPEPRITIRTRREGADCVIEVADNGPGIAVEHQPRLFEPFFTTKPVGQGTGLGLSICARLVKEQGGTICLTSPPGVGAVFSIRLPAVEAPELAAAN
ncbi:MAG TPA: ATP-binding protein [Phycisphaerales bacterium]|nr:ATP-binding protein [Phycisphaerales bacterium]